MTGNNAESQWRRYEQTSPTTAQQLILKAVPPGSNVLELGASTGYMSKWLRDKGCYVVAAEYDPNALTLLSASADEAKWGDLEVMETMGWLKGRRFDSVLLADVLEHLRNPEEVLTWLHEVVNGGGRVYISMPNVAFWRVRYELARGKWPLADTGILDRTHVHFYTRASAERMFRAAGWSVIMAMSADESYPFDRRIRSFERALPSWAPKVKPRLNRGLLWLWPDLFTYQYVWVLASPRVSG